jgi:general secretion pathway protein K
MVKIINDRRGVALLITLTVIALLIVTTLELNRKARSAVFSAAAARDRITLSQMTSSAINLAMAILVKDKKESEADSLQEDWADPEKIKEALESIAFEEGTLTLNINDELSRIQVNALVEFPEGRFFNEAQRLLWDRGLRLAISFDEASDDIDPAITIINSLKDWLDSGDDDAITGLSGAESEYYQDLDPPYSCKNSPITHLSELLQVKGVTPDIFFGSEENPGLSNYLTVSGITAASQNNFTFRGKININTADLPIIAALLPEESQGLALAIQEHRMEKTGTIYTHDLSSDTWYKNVPGAGDINIDEDLITTKSDVFMIETTASLHDQKMIVIAVVQREQNSETNKYNCRVLSWEEE